MTIEYLYFLIAAVCMIVSFSHGYSTGSAQ